MPDVDLAIEVIAPIPQRITFSCRPVKRGYKILERQDKTSLAATAQRSGQQAHPDRLGIPALGGTPDPVCIATEGALWGSVKVHSLLPDTVDRQRRCRPVRCRRARLVPVHAERIVHKPNTFTDQQHPAQ